MLSSVPDNNSVRSVERAFDLLAVLEAADHPLGLSPLARAAGVPTTTALRLLTVLERRGLVEKDLGRYQLGTAIVSLSRAFLTRNTLSRAALPILEELTVLSGETASLYARRGFQRIIVQRVNSPNPVRFSIRVGEQLPLHLGSGGRVLTAAMPEEELRRFLDQLGEIRLASGEILSREEFLAKLERVRRQGFAVSLEERSIGVVSVAAPVVRSGKAVTVAVGVTGPPSRMTPERIELLSVEVRRAAADIALAWSHV